jgi:hypothetical protein
MIPSRARRLLESRRIVLLAVVLGVLLTAGTCFTSLQTEDWVQRALVKAGDYRFPTKVNLYGHHEPRPWDTVEREIFDYRVFGWFPWITYHRFDVSFWRPIASLTHLLDYRLWPDRAWLMHLESVLWYGALVGAVACVYRRMLAMPWLAGAAALLYAADDAHGHAVGWLANRNGIMATFFGVLALYWLDGWRRGGSRAAAWLMPVFLFVALLCAEFALSVIGYFIAYALFVDAAPTRRRIVATLPWVGTVAGWAALYRALGHAAHGSGLYVNPVNDPLAFTREVAERATMFLASAVGGPPSDLWARVDRADQGLVVFVSATVLLVAVQGLWPLFRADREVRFWASGAVLSVPPACATFPEDRLLFFVGLGAMPVIAIFCARALSSGADLWRHPRAARLAAMGLVAVHAVLAPVLLPYRTLHMARYDAEMQAEARELFGRVTDPAHQFVVLVNAKDFYFAGMMPLSRVARGEPTVARFLTLAGTRGPVALTRLDERTLEVRPEGGFMTRVFSQIFRGRANVLHRGARIDLLGIDVTVTDVDPWGEPLAATFEFAFPLETPSFLWIYWTGAAYEPFHLPKTGETVIVRSDA